MLIAASVDARTATILGATLFGTCGACTREPCVTLDRYWGGPEAWRRHEDEPKPRCAASDPNCGPEPTLALGNATMATHYSIDETCYRPSAKRERLPPREPAKTGPEYACSHDGDCQLAGNCATACVAYRARDFIASCVRNDWLEENTFCGCVEGACSFFRQ